MLFFILGSYFDSLPCLVNESLGLQNHLDLDTGARNILSNYDHNVEI